MSKYFELAEKIYEALLAKGAGIGNASIPIIIKVLEEHDAAEHTLAVDTAKYADHDGDCTIHLGYGICTCGITLRRATKA